MSYSHAADGRLSPAVHEVLQSLAKPGIDAVQSGCCAINVCRANGVLTIWSRP
jgi:hypothetical protein